MDNRRYARPSARDLRQPGDRPTSTDVEELGSAEVEVVELSEPPKERRLSPGTVWVAIAIVGVIGFAAGLNFPRGESRGASPTGVPVAEASPPLAEASPGPDASPDGAIPSTPRAPSTPRPTPRPTRTPAPGEWQLYDIGLTENSATLGLWTLGGQFVLPFRSFADDDGTWSNGLMESLTGRTWVKAPVPPAIEELQAATVHDGRLWFLARVGGVGTTKSELISTDGRGDWASLGPAQGLGLEDGGASTIAHVADRWVVPSYSYACCDGGAVDQKVRTSRDGIHWSITDVGLAANDAITSSFSFGDVLGLVGVASTDPDNPTSFVITTRDGKRWSRSDIAPETVAQLYGITCTETVCAAFGARTVPGGFVSSIATSTNGLDWTLVEAEQLPDVTTMTTTPRGFLGVGSSTGSGWVSPDGITWRGIDVIRVPAWYIGYLGVNGDYVAAIGGHDDGAGGSALGSWAGELSSLEE